MRKFLAFLLTALMVVSVLAALPVSAAIPNSVPAELVGNKNTDTPALVVTEVMYDSGAPKEGSDQYEFQNVYDYIEVYNAGNTAIDLYDLALVYTGDSGLEFSSNWVQDEYTFKSGIRALVVDNFTAQGSTTYTISNPANASLQPGQIAVLWIWTGSTLTACDTAGKNLSEMDMSTDPVSGDYVRADSNGNPVYFPAFRDFYKALQADTGTTVSDDLLIVAVNGTQTGTNCPKDASNASKTFDINTSARMYGIVKKTFGFPLSPVYDNHGLDDDVLCLFNVGSGLKNSITSASEVYTGLANLYVPAAAVPDVYNKLERQSAEADDRTYTDEEDYVSAKISISYRQSALMLYAESPTVGTMPDYQWMYVDPARVPAEIGADANWQTTALNTLIDARVIDFETNGDHTETANEVANVTQEDILNKIGSNTRTYTVTKLTTWGLILIIVGAVVGVAGIVVLVLLLVKKKKKNQPLSEEDLAFAEAPTDDAPVEEAPAEEAPAEEAPAEENTEEPKE